VDKNIFRAPFYPASIYKLFFEQFINHWTRDFWAYEQNIGTLMLDPKK
jgi:hypothetical protein